MSFLSVRAGAGRSTLSLAAARAAAKSEPRSIVVLIELTAAGHGFEDRVLLETEFERVPVPNEALASIGAPPEIVRPRIEARSRLIETLQGRVSGGGDGELTLGSSGDALLYTPRGDGSPEAAAFSFALRRPSDGHRLQNLFVLPASPIPEDVDLLDADLSRGSWSERLTARLLALLNALCLWAGPTRTLVVVLDAPANPSELARVALRTGTRAVRDLPEARWVAWTVTRPSAAEVSATMHWIGTLSPCERAIAREAINFATNNGYDRRFRRLDKAPRVPENQKARWFEPGVVAVPAALDDIAPELCDWRRRQDLRSK